MRPLTRTLASLRPLALGAGLFGATLELSAQGIADRFGEGRERPRFRATIFFPPLPPPLDSAIPTTITEPIHPSAPSELAEHVGEYFYPQLSARLHGKSLSDRHSQAIASYRAAKIALQQEIRLELATTRDADPAARRSALQSLARRQASRLAALEAAAEALRRDLVSAELHWSSHREWHLSRPERRAFSPAEIALVMLAGAYYERDLLPEQRGLLLEIAHELRHAGLTIEVAAVAQPHVFFSPSPSRLLWPRNSPPTVLAQLAAYQAKKAGLKKELFETVQRHDSPSVRLFARPFAELAAKQAPRLAELERIAEEIRAGLAPHLANAVLPHSPVPPQMAEAATELTRRRNLLKREATLQMEGIAERIDAEELNLRVTFRFEPDGLKFVVIPGHGPASDTRHVEAVGREISAVADEYGRGLTAVANAEEQLRAEIATFIGNNQPAAVGQAFDAAVVAATAERHAPAYADYRAAVFEPGLSPAQRRVLFDGAIEMLELELPRGVRQPMRLAETW